MVGLTRLLASALALALLVLGGYWLWRSPWMELPRAYAELTGLPAPTALPMPAELGAR